ncbi:MAG: hypothetical protein V2I67_19535 [Thermoanaerobaculales bacterium]|nr:hypothetical protein [Thermoanaerobaculales bacterium]
MSAFRRYRSLPIAAAVIGISAALLHAAEVVSSQAIAKAVAAEGRSETDQKRDTTSKPTQVLEFFGLKPGMTVIDLFGGGGYYTELAALAVGDTGKVYYHTNHAYLPFVETELEMRFENDRLDGVVRIVSETDDMRLPEAEADLLLMVMCYHDLYVVDEGWPAIDREHFWRQIYAAIKPGGVLGVVDHIAATDTGSTAAQTLHRIDKNFAKTDIESVGFVFEAESDVLRNPEDDHTLIVFNPEIRRKTDRFVYRFRKPADT